MSSHLRLSVKSDKSQIPMFEVLPDISLPSALNMSLNNSANSTGACLSTADLGRYRFEAGSSDPHKCYKLNVVLVIENFFDQVPELRDEQK